MYAIKEAVKGDGNDGFPVGGGGGGISTKAQSMVVCTFCPMVQPFVSQGTLAAKLFILF